MTRRSLDFLTSALNRSSDILFALNPRGTSLGVFFGIAFYGFLGYVYPGYFKGVHWNAMQGRGVIFYFIAGGIALFNLPQLFSRRRLPDEIEDAFEAIRRLKQGGASPAQVKLELLALCQAVIERAKLDEAKLAKGRKRKSARKSPAKPVA